MTSPELQKLIKELDTALATISQAQGTLSARQIRIKSLLAVLREEVFDELLREDEEGMISGRVVASPGRSHPETADD